MARSDILLADVAIRRPISGLRYAFRSKTLLSGSSASVLHYNVLSLLSVAKICRVLGIPTISFVGDFGFPARSSTIEAAMFSLKNVADFLCMILKESKNRDSE